MLVIPEFPFFLLHIVEDDHMFTIFLGCGTGLRTCHLAYFLVPLVCITTLIVSDIPPSLSPFCHPTK